MAQAKKTAKKAKKKTVRRKTATKPRAVAAEVIRAEPNGSLLDPSAIQAATETLVAAVDTFREELSVLPEDGEMSQTHLEVARFAAFAKGAMGDLEKIFAANALRLRVQGSFAPGSLRVDFDLQKGKRTPAWKDEAVKQAKALAEKRGDVFNAEQFAEGVLQNTTPKDDTRKPIIRETG